MREEWLAEVRRLVSTPADFFSGGRKIIRNRTVTFRDLTPDIFYEDVGYTTKGKSGQLRRNYLHREARDAAVTLWEAKLGGLGCKYGSVGFHCFAHYVKGKSGVNIERCSPHASVMGPCMSSVVITRLEDKTAWLDVFWRTTEFFKKFPADMAFLPELIQPFDFSKTPLRGLTCHFANCTSHPMYLAAVLPLFEDPIALLEVARAEDPKFWALAVKWTGRYICEEFERGILKFSQALHVRDHVREALNPYDLERLREYVRANHEGYRNEYVAPGGDDDSQEDE